MREDARKRDGIGEMRSASPSDPRQVQPEAEHLGSVSQYDLPPHLAASLCCSVPKMADNTLQTPATHVARRHSHLAIDVVSGTRPRQRRPQAHVGARKLCASHRICSHGSPVKPSRIAGYGQFFCTISPDEVSGTPDDEAPELAMSGQALPSACTTFATRSDSRQLRGTVVP